MHKNVSTWDALFRITVGLAGLAWSASMLARKRPGIIVWLVALMSGMKVAEGITRYCPLLSLLRNAKSQALPIQRENGVRFFEMDTHH